MVNIERTRPGLSASEAAGGHISDKYYEDRPYTSGEAPGIAIHVQNSLRK